MKRISEIKLLEFNFVIKYKFKNIKIVSTFDKINNSIKFILSKQSIFFNV